MHSLLTLSVLQRCPACGKGGLFTGVLRLRERCPVCDLSLKEHEKGDGPAVFVITVVGFIITGLAAWVELAYEPPFWVHAALWLPLIIGLSLWLLRVFKAMIIAVQYRNLGLR